MDSKRAYRVRCNCGYVYLLPEGSDVEDPKGVTSQCPRCLNWKQFRRRELHVVEHQVEVTARTS